MYGINEKSYWFFWDEYIQEEYKLLTEILGLNKQIKAINKTVKSTNDDLKRHSLNLRKEITDEEHLQAIEDYEIDKLIVIIT